MTAAHRGLPLENRLREPVEHTRQAGGSGIIHRVSSIFMPRKKAPPPHLALVNTALRTTPRRNSWSSTRDSGFESEDDDIRLPSGLGSAASHIQSFPPSPLLLQKFPPPPGYRLSRSPTLVRAFSYEDGSPVLVSPVPNAPPRELLSPDVLAHVLPYLPHSDLATIAIASRRYTGLVHAELYAHIDLDTLSPSQVARLLSLLASRGDRAELLRSFSCRSWPAGFSPADPGSALLGRALARMAHLLSLTLPAWDTVLLSNHTAFGLQALTICQTTLGARDAAALFGWLDGQTNIVTLCFPNLVDAPAPPPRARSRPPTGPIATSIPTLTSHTRSHSYSTSLVAQFGAPTLLPGLTTLHAPPALALALLPPRPISRLSLSLSTTLYAGLRPAALMRTLRGGELSHLSLCIPRKVDRRTAGKAVGAVGAALGGKRKGRRKSQKIGTGDHEEHLQIQTARVLPHAPTVRLDAVPDFRRERKTSTMTLGPRLVARDPIVRDEDDEGSEPDPSSPPLPQVAISTLKTYTLPETRERKTSTKTLGPRLVARGPIVRDDDEDEDENNSEATASPPMPPAPPLSQPLPPSMASSPASSPPLPPIPTAAAPRRLRKISALSRKSTSPRLIPRAPIVRDDDDDDDEQEAGPAPEASAPWWAVPFARDRTLSTRTRKDSTRTTKGARKGSTAPQLVARVPLVRDEDADVVAGSSTGARQRTQSAAPKLVARAPVVRDEESDEDQAETENSSRPALSTVPKLVARAPIVRDEDSDEDQVETEKGAVPALSRVQPESGTSTVAKLVARAPIVRDEESDEGPEDGQWGAQWVDASKRPVSFPLLGGKTRPESGMSAKSASPKLVARAPTIRDEDDATGDEDEDEDDGFESDTGAWAGLRSLEVVFHGVQMGENALREEAVYKSVSASLTRYASLTSLRLRVLAQDGICECANAPPPPPAQPRPISAKEQHLLDSWATLCPTLLSITLFSGAKWERSKHT